MIIYIYSTPKIGKIDEHWVYLRRSNDVSKTWL